MKKIMLMFLSLFLLTGCTAEYTLNIDEKMDNFEENLTLSTDINSDDYDYLKNYDRPKPIDYKITGYSETDEKMDGVIYYDLYKKDDYDKTSLTYSYNFSRSQFLNSGIVHTCFSGITYFTDDQDNTTIKTSSGFQCFSKYPPLEEVVVKIVTKKNVVYHNADSVKDNTYTWRIKKNNENRNIHIIVNEKKSEETVKSSTYMMIAGICILGFILLILIIVIYKNRKYNGK